MREILADLIIKEVTNFVQDTKRLFTATTIFFLLLVKIFSLDTKSRREYKEKYGGSVGNIYSKV